MFEGICFKALFHTSEQLACILICTKPHVLLKGLHRACLLKYSIMKLLTKRFTIFNGIMG
jgi:hypothetical protein